MSVKVRRAAAASLAVDEKQFREKNDQYETAAQSIRGPERRDGHHYLLGGARVRLPFSLRSDKRR